MLGLKLASTLLAPAVAPAEPLSRSAQALADAAHLAPMMLVGFWALLHIAADAFASVGLRDFQRRLGFVGLVLAAGATMMQISDTQYDAGVAVFSGFLEVDQFSLLLDFGILGVAAATIGFAGSYARSHRFEYGEQEALILIATFGVMVLNHAGDLLAVFLGIETMSIAVYVLVGARWNSRRSPEAALKYFLMGAFASALLVMGIALLYGATGTTNLHQLQQRVMQLLTGGRGSWQASVADLNKITMGTAAGPAFDAARDRIVVAFAPAALLIPGMLLTLSAFLFKISAVPLHMWTADAYDGAPTPTTAFMASGVKIGGFAALLKVFVVTLAVPRLVHAPYGWAGIVGVLALLTMTVGNLAALRQTNVKRLLAYSSIAHVGYLLIGVVAAASFFTDETGNGQVTLVDEALWGRDNGELAVASVLLYLGVYGIAALGTFACVAHYGANKREAMGVHEWAGMAQRHPGIALAMTICLLSLMGIPPTAGFFGKLALFRVGLENGNMLLRVLVVGALLNAVVAAYAYLRLIVAMYFRAPPAAPVEVQPARGAAVVVAVAASLSLCLGLGAGWAMKRCQLAAAGFGYSAGSPNKGKRVAELRARWADAEAPAEAVAADSDAPEAAVSPASGDAEPGEESAAAPTPGLAPTAPAVAKKPEPAAPNPGAPAKAPAQAKPAAAKAEGTPTPDSADPAAPTGQSPPVPTKPRAVAPKPGEQPPKAPSPKP